MSIKLAFTALLNLLFTLAFSQDDGEMSFNVKKKSPKPVAKTYFYQKISRSPLTDTAYSNIITIEPDSFTCYAYTKQTAGDTTADRMNKTILYVGKYGIANDSVGIHYHKPGLNDKSNFIFSKVKNTAPASDFSWTRLLAGADPTENQKARYTGVNEVIQIDTNTFDCFKVIFMRDTSVRNEVPIKIRGRRWYAPGSHKEVIATHVYFRSSDYLPVKIIELFPSKYSDNYFSPWLINTTWFLKRAVE
jgi:hypothetical protein